MASVRCEKSGLFQGFFLGGGGKGRQSGRATERLKFLFILRQLLFWILYTNYL